MSEKTDLKDSAGNVASNPRDVPYLVYDDYAATILNAVRSMVSGGPPHRADERVELVADLREYVEHEKKKIEGNGHRFRIRDHIRLNRSTPEKILSEFDCEIEKFRAVAFSESCPLQPHELPGSREIKPLDGPLQTLLSQLALAILVRLVDAVIEWIKNRD